MPFAKELVLKEGSQFKPVCTTVQGSSPIEFIWSKDNEKVAPDPNIEISTIENTLSTLSIKKIAIRHAGSYTCMVRNVHGQDRSTVVLKVKCENILLS